MLKEMKKSLANGFAFAAGIALFGGVSFLLADSLHTFNSGDVVSSSNLNANFNKLPPVGAVIAWHKNQTGVSTTLPDGWLECNGQTVSDSESTLNGQALPDLNSPANAWNTRGSFLRGHSASGLWEEDEIQGHYHTTTGLPQGIADVTAPTGPPTGVWRFTTSRNTGDPITGGHGTIRMGNETRSVNMSVVWIIRIK